MCSWWISFLELFQATSSVVQPTGTECANFNTPRWSLPRIEDDGTWTYGDQPRIPWDLPVRDSLPLPRWAFSIVKNSDRANPWATRGHNAPLRVGSADREIRRTTPQPPTANTRTPSALAERPVAIAVQIRSHHRFPASLRVPCVTTRSRTTNRIAGSARLFVGSTPGVVSLPAIARRPRVGPGIREGCPDFGDDCRMPLHSGRVETRDDQGLEARTV